MEIDWYGSLLEGWNIKQGVVLKPRVKFHSGPEGSQGFSAIWEHKLQELAVVFLIQCCKELMGKEQGNGLVYVAFERNFCLSGIEVGLLLKLFGSWVLNCSLGTGKSFGKGLLMYFMTSLCMLLGNFPAVPNPAKNCKPARLHSKGCISAAALWASSWAY